MKKSILVLAAVIVAFTVTSCKSKEEKAAEELIKQELSQVLYDFESYEPIETVVTEANNVPINDSACVNTALTVIVSENLIIKYLDEASYESKAERVDAIKKANIYIKKYSSSIDDLKIMTKNANPTETIGYNVEHTFYYKTKGGMSTVGHYRFVVDKKFERIIFYYPEEDTNYDTTYYGIRTSHKISGLIDNLDTREKMDTIDWKPCTKYK